MPENRIDARSLVPSNVSFAVDLPNIIYISIRNNIAWHRLVTEPTCQRAAENIARHFFVPFFRLASRVAKIKICYHNEGNTQTLVTTHILGKGDLRNKENDENDFQSSRYSSGTLQKVYNRTANIRALPHGELDEVHKI